MVNIFAFLPAYFVHFQENFFFIISSQSCGVVTIFLYFYFQFLLISENKTKIYLHAVCIVALATSSSVFMFIWRKIVRNVKVAHAQDTYLLCTCVLSFGIGISYNVLSCEEKNVFTFVFLGYCWLPVFIFVISVIECFNRTHAHTQIPTTKSTKKKTFFWCHLYFFYIFQHA